MAQLTVDFSGFPDGVRRFEGGGGMPPPFVFLRDFRHTNTIPPTTLMHDMGGDVNHTHTVTDKRDLTFSARQHVMSHPYGDGGFQIIHHDLARVLYDGDMTVSVDISTKGYGSRKWPLFWFYPEGELASGKKAADPGFIDAIRDHLDLFAVPDSALFFKPERFNGEIGWGGWRTTGSRFGAYWNPIPVEESFVTRSPHRFEFFGRDMAFYIGDKLHWSASGVVPTTWQGRRIVVALDFVDYNSAKDGDGETTWHWDNVLVRANHVEHAPGAILGYPTSGGGHEHPDPGHEHPEEPGEPDPEPHPEPEEPPHEHPEPEDPEPEDPEPEDPEPEDPEPEEPSPEDPPPHEHPPHELPPVTAEHLRGEAVKLEEAAEVLLHSAMHFRQVADWMDAQ